MSFAEILDEELVSLYIHTGNANDERPGSSRFFPTSTDTARSASLFRRHHEVVLERWQRRRSDLARHPQCKASRRRRESNLTIPHPT
jgi:hypothetical protein